MSKLRPDPTSPSNQGAISFQETAKAGAIVFRKTDNKIDILLVHRTKQDDWSFPKGHVESGEGLFEAALREVREETGLHPMLIGRIEDLVYKDSKDQIVKLVMFLGLDEGSTNPRATAKEQATWIPLNKVESTLSYENLRHYWRRIQPALHSKRKEISCDIVFSTKEPYRAAAEALRTGLLEEGISSSLIEPKKLHLQKAGKTSRGLYFLSDLPQLNILAFWAGEFEKAHVVNLSAWHNWGSKSMIQFRLHQAGLSVPELKPHALKKKEKSKNFLLKSELHGIRRKGIFERFLSDPWLLYHEKNVQRRDFNEHKIWSVGGEIFANDPSVLTEKIRVSIHRVQELLGLEVLSIDMFIGPKGKHFIIDVNRAPGFYRNEKARKAFTRYIRNRISLPVRSLFG